jgi:glycosyltransferase involved in cell wall biosynthesis
LLTYLARRGPVDAIVFRQPGCPDPAAQFPQGLVRDLHVVQLPHHSRAAALRAIRNLRRAALGVSPLIDRFAGFGGEIAEFLRGRQYRLSVIEHFWCAPYLEQLAPHSARVMLDLHNIESVLHQRCARAERPPVAWLHHRFQAASRHLERELLPRFSALLTASEQDAEFVRQICGDCPVYVYPNAIPWVAEPALPEEDAIVFSGNLEYHPNTQAVRYFRREVWPLLRERWPGLVWRLIGKNPDAVKTLVAGDTRIELVGPVADAIQALAAAKVAIVPLLAGSGTRIKILEAWAAGRAVVSTSLGAEGLPAMDGRHLLVADGARPFAEAVSSLLENEEIRRNLGRAGRALYEQQFTWEAAWAKLEAVGL